MKTKLTMVIAAMTAIILNSLQKTNGQANTALSNLSTTTAINHSLYPKDDNARDLGSASKSWRVLYLDSGVYLKDEIFMHSAGSAGSSNAFVGFHAGKSITSGVQNAAFGYNALPVNTTGSQNTALGKAVLYTNTDGSFNSGSGYEALFYNWHGSYNTASGAYSLFHNINGSENTATGYNALRDNTQGEGNTASGAYASFDNTTGSYNTAVGYKALYSNTDGNNNTALGIRALESSTTGLNNVAIGPGALRTCITGNFNAAIGTLADVILPGSDYNTIVGNVASIEGNNSTVIGYGAYTNTSNLALLGSTTTVYCGGYANWTNYASDRRLKTQVKENVKGLDFIRRLRPVTYHLDLMSLYKIQGISPYGKQADKMTAAMKADMDKNIRNKEAFLMSGFIAQEVEKAAQESGYDFDGVKKPQNDKDNYGLSYATFVVPLVKAVQELDKKAQEINELTTQVQEQSREINELKQLVQTFIQAKTISASNSYLKQNIPNPSNGSTVIPFLIAKNSHFAVIQIAQAASGKIVKTINVDVNATQVSFNTKSLAASSYLYSLIVDGKIADTKQMTITDK